MPIYLTVQKRPLEALQKNKKITLKNIDKFVDSGFVKTCDELSTVINKMIPQRRTRKYDEEMCFWLGPDYDRRGPPRPIDRKVSIKELDEMTIYVR